MNTKATNSLFISGETGETLMIRTCAVDSNSLTTDTELVRIPESCGIFDFVADARPNPNDDVVHRLNGCISVCEDVDGCNRAPLAQTGSVLIGAAALVVMNTISSEIL